MFFFHRRTIPRFPGELPAVQFPSLTLFSLPIKQGQGGWRREGNSKKKLSDNIDCFMRALTCDGKCSLCSPAAGRPV